MPTAVFAKIRILSPTGSDKCEFWNNAGIIVKSLLLTLMGWGFLIIEELS